MKRSAWESAQLDRYAVAATWSSLASRASQHAACSSNAAEVPSISGASPWAMMLRRLISSGSQSSASR